MRVKVADFGTATLVDLATNVSSEAGAAAVTVESPLSLEERVRTMRTKGIGTPLWMAPEILSGSSAYGASADVFSFGIVMWEIASRQEPWADLKGSFIMDLLLENLKAGRRPKIEESWPRGYTELMEDCWSTDPSARPTFSKVVHRLEEKIDTCSS